MSWEPAQRRSVLVRVGAFAVVAGIGFAVFGVNPVPAGDERAAEESDVREAVLRYQFHHNASSQRANARVFCVTVGGQDPDYDFLQRFAGGGVPVRKASDCNVSEQGVVDKATGVQGLKLAAGKVEWITGGEVRVDGGYYEASLSASGNTYRLRKQAKGWTVVESLERWIS